MTGSLIESARVAYALGLPNVARVLGYRLGVKSGTSPVCRLRAPAPIGPFFGDSKLSPLPVTPIDNWQTSAWLFGRWRIAINDGPPDWFTNPLTGQRIDSPDRPWYRIPDFDPSVGDIKLIWEFSRMDWVLAFAQHVRNGDHGALERMNTWLTDWCARNSPYRGPNWKCGQEASIRVLHLACAALMLGQVWRPKSGLQELVRVHLRRIVPTVHYAMAQDNNHGTSEAAALFVGGSWLATQGGADGKRWQKIGRRWLENRAARLIGHQGTFSQYSLNYQRVMLDTFSFVEVWRRQLNLPDFSDRWRSRAIAAAEWLRHMVNPVNGDGPNVGANDGARLFPLTSTAFRDFRPTVQLSMAVFAKQCAYSPNGLWNHSLDWLGVPVPRDMAPGPGHYVADDGGFAVLRRGRAMVMLRYPRFRFRPSQADALHVDLWVGGENLLRDGGSYSYNAESKWMDYFGGTASHNTVQFDGRNQMPRLGRFLLGSWLRTTHFETLQDGPESTCFAAGYRDCEQAHHRRKIVLQNSLLRVVDQVDGFRDNCVVRWRLCPKSWSIATDERKVQVVHGPWHLAIEADVPISRASLVEGWESRHYLDRSLLPVLEIETRKPCRIVSEYRWSD